MTVSFRFTSSGTFDDGSGFGSFHQVHLMMVSVSFHFIVSSDTFDDSSVSFSHRMSSDISRVFVGLHGASSDHLTCFRGPTRSVQ